MVGIKLCDDKDFFTRNARISNCLTDFCFVTIGVGCVNETDTTVESCCNRIFTFLIMQTIGSKTVNWHVVATIQCNSSCLKIKILRIILYLFCKRSFGVRNFPFGFI